MKCPKCDSQMSEVTFDNITVDRCTGCQGIWFDELEAEKLKDMKGAEVIDTGDEVTGKEMNTVDRIKCPVCNVPMIRLVDNEQPHIWYEGCSVCYGRFFDAGEFKDYKKKDLGSFIKDLLSPARK